MCDPARGSELGRSAFGSARPQRPAAVTDRPGLPVRPSTGRRPGRPDRFGVVRSVAHLIAHRVAHPGAHRVAHLVAQPVACPPIRAGRCRRPGPVGQRPGRSDTSSPLQPEQRCLSLSRGVPAAQDRHPVPPAYRHPLGSHRHPRAPGDGGRAVPMTVQIGQGGGGGDGANRDGSALAASPVRVRNVSGAGPAGVRCSPDHRRTTAGLQPDPYRTRRRIASAGGGL